MPVAGEPTYRELERDVRLLRRALEEIRRESIPLESCGEDCVGFKTYRLATTALEATR